ncbi:hypothetical protein COU36_01215 [Candidatus Micrarchaeota archaeon CG10_big_fil_rev_8_21_14_0_10_59_7]|nr:MAG: hypothetical protein COU36_01215 [Candidatus Micrarchaeota archaeon CG10_big_fil_rev_8_21_14_0_10_59_7]
MDLLALLLLVFPAYVANSVPVVFGGGPRIDGGRNFIDGRRLFGNGKTLQGFLSGVAFGIAAGVVAVLLLNGKYLPEASFATKMWLICAMAFGAMAGDLLGSFIKRRLGIGDGEASFVIDQMPFIIVALFLALLAYPPLLGALGPDGLAFILVLTVLLHYLFNLLAHRLRLKKVPW